MFKAIHSSESLRRLNLNAEAKLSDMFILLYALYLISANETKISKISIHKLITYVLETLEDNKKRAEIHLFNLPQYKWQYGTYNQSLETEYLNTLTSGLLIKRDPLNPLNYSLTEDGLKLIEEYIDRVPKNNNVDFFDDTVNKFSDTYLRDFSFDKVRDYSHNIKISVDNSTKKVHDLDNNDKLAIIYNSEDFNNGKRADIIPPEFITKLSLLLEESKPIDAGIDTEGILSKFL